MRAKVFPYIIVVAVVMAVMFFLSVIGLDAFLPSDPYASAKPDYGMVFERMDVRIDWNADRSCRIVQSLDVRFLDNAGSHGIYVDIPVNSGESVRGLSVTAKGNYRYGGNGYLPYSIEHESGFKIVRVIVGDEDRSFYADDSLTCTLEYDYITPVHPDGDDLLDINAIGYGWQSPVHAATVTVTYPTEPTADGIRVLSGTQSVQNELAGDKVTVSSDRKTISVNAGELAPFNGVRVKCKMPDGALTARFDAQALWSIAIGMILLGVTVTLMLLFGRDKPLTPAVDFYPPRIDGMRRQKRHMLPVQMGKLIDNTCSMNDVTSLIFYWASKGYLAIEDDADRGETTLIKLRPIDPVTTYEKSMFDKLFENGVEDDDGGLRVEMSSLKGKFAETIAATKAAVDSEYSGKLYRRGYSVLAWVLLVACALFGAGFAVFSSFRVAFGCFNPIGLTALIPVAVAGAIGFALVRYYLKLSSAKRKASLVALFAATLLTAVGTMFAVPTSVMGWVEKGVFAFSLAVSAAIAPFLTKRTAFYDEQLNNILGFRDFLRDAEKERLEMLIADDPQYYYNILPYANVLGVSDIWEDKFKEITVEPPSYYRGNDISLFNILIINRLCRSVGSTLTYSPPKANGGSFSGGSSHGGGGGGSFGGFGGGGGGRW